MKTQAKIPIVDGDQYEILSLSFSQAGTEARMHAHTQLHKYMYTDTHTLRAGQGGRVLSQVARKINVSLDYYIDFQYSLTCRSSC